MLAKLSCITLIAFVQSREMSLRTDCTDNRLVASCRVMAESLTAVALCLMGVGFVSCNLDPYSCYI